MATNDAWLDQITEAALEPNLPICDTHHHLWDQLKGRVEPQYLLDEFQKDLQSGHTIVSNEEFEKEKARREEIEKKE